MSDKRDNLDKIGTYSTIRLPFELNAEQLSKLPPGKELHFDRAKQTVRGGQLLLRRFACLLSNRTFA